MRNSEEDFEQGKAKRSELDRKLLERRLIEEKMREIKQLRAAFGKW